MPFAAGESGVSKEPKTPTAKGTRMVNRVAGQNRGVDIRADDPSLTPAAGLLLVSEVDAALASLIHAGGRAVGVAAMR
jgi:hypothetical protein